MNLKYIRVTIALLLLFGLTLSACATTPAEPADEMPAATDEEITEEVQEESGGEKAKVQIFIGLGTGTAPDQADAQMELQEAFNSTHDDIELEFLIVPHEESTERYLAMVAGGNAPEIIGVAGLATIGQFLDNVEDLTPYIEADNYDVDNFYGPVVDLMQDFYPGETIPALPLGIYPSMIFYNEDLFDAAGLPYPPHDYDDTSWTMEQLREYAMKLTLDENGNDATSPDFDPDNIAQWGFDDSWIDARGYLAKWDAPNVGRPTTDDYQTAVANSDEWVYGMQWLSDGIWEDHFIPDLTGQEAYYAIGGDPFGGGMVAMFYSHTWFFPEGLTDLPFEHNLAPIPFNHKGTRVARADADGIAMSAAADEKEAAWEVMKWLVDQENIVDVCLIYGCLPPIQAVEDDMRTQMAGRWPGLDFDVIYDSLDYLDNPHHTSWVPEQGRVRDAMDYALEKVYTGDDKDAQAVLDEANTTIQKILDDYWADQASDE